mgnify:CR=1 FL=1
MPAESTPAVCPLILETPRLILRTVDRDDLQQVVQTWDPNGTHISQDQADRQVRWMLSNHGDLAAGKLTHLCLAVIHKDSGAWVGWCGLDNREDTGEGPALFYVVRTPHRGRGFATEAARAVLAHALTEINIPEVLARTKPDNPASRRVLDKLGMRYLGRHRAGDHSFALTQKEFLNIR